MKWAFLRNTQLVLILIAVFTFIAGMSTIHNGKRMVRVRFFLLFSCKARKILFLIRFLENDFFTGMETHKFMIIDL